MKTHIQIEVDLEPVRGLLHRRRLHSVELHVRRSYPHYPQQPMQIPPSRVGECENRSSFGASNRRPLTQEGADDPHDEQNEDYSRADTAPPTNSSFPSSLPSTLVLLRSVDPQPFLFRNLVLSGQLCRTQAGNRHQI
jgi:hypothetical protein